MSRKISGFKPNGLACEEFKRGKALRQAQAGFMDCLRSAPNSGWVVIYRAEAQGIDVGNDPYAVVCENHATICGTSTLKDARRLMESVEFCEECVGTEDKKNEFSYTRNRKEIFDWLHNVVSLKLVAIQVREPAWIRRTEIEDRLEKSKAAFLRHDGKSLFIQAVDEHGASLMLEFEK